MLRNLQRTTLVGLISLSASWITPVLAEEDADAIEEEIIVTATYRDTRLMDTPLTISAVTAEDIALKGIEDIQTLYQSIPGLSYRTNSQTYNTLSIRGLTPPSSGGSSVVGVYMDDMPITDSQNGGLRQTLGPLFDVARVEVLKGPQGTLYGEGAMGGNLRYISNRPDPRGLSWSAKLTSEAIGESSGLSYVAHGMLNVPIGDQLAARLVGYKRDRKGVIDQVAPRNEKDVDTFEEEGLRATVSWYPSDTVEVSALVNVIDGVYGGPGLGFHCFTESTPSDPAGQVPSYDLPGTTCAGEMDQFNREPYVTHLAHPTHTSGGWDEQEMMNLTVRWELPFGATFTSSTSSFDRHTNYSEETSPRFAAGVQGIVNYACYGANPLCGPGMLTSMGGDGAFAAKTERFAQELRLVSDSDSRFKWTVGAYYKNEDSVAKEFDDCTTGGSPVYATFDAPCYLQYSFADDVPLDTQRSIINTLNMFIPGNADFKNYGERSFYGEVSYAINDEWEVLAGARQATVNFDLDIGQPSSSSPENPMISEANETKMVSPKVTVTWRPKTDWMIYGTFSHGFRPGIINNGLVSRIAELEPLIATDPIARGHYERLDDLRLVDGDEAINLELGVKATVLDGRLSFTTAIYDIEWKDTIIGMTDQIDDVVGVTPFSYGFNVNSGGAESQGMEFEIRAKLSDNLSLNLGGDFNWTAKINSGGAGRYAGVDITPGNRLANAPKHSAYGSLVYDFTLGGNAASVRGDAYRVAESWNTANNERPAPAYTTLDVKLLVYRGDWRFAAYVRNLTDEVIVYEFNQVGFRFGRPRTIGLEATYTPGG